MVGIRLLVQFIVQNILTADVGGTGPNLREGARLDSMGLEKRECGRMVLQGESRLLSCERCVLLTGLCLRLVSPMAGSPATQPRTSFPTSVVNRPACLRDLLFSAFGIASQ